MRILEQVNNLSNETEMILLNQIFLLVEDSLAIRDSLLYNVSGQLLSSAQDLSSDIPNILSSVSSAEVQELFLARNSANLNNVVTQLSLSVASLNGATNFAVSEVNQSIFQIDSQVNVIQDASAELTFVLPSFLNATSDLLADLDNIQAVSISVKVGIDLFNNCIIAGF